MTSRGAAKANSVHGESRKEGTLGRTITIEHKHSLAIRCMHWINFPLPADGDREHLGGSLKYVPRTATLVAAFVQS